MRLINVVLIILLGDFRKVVLSHLHVWEELLELGLQCGCLDIKLGTKSLQ